MIDFCCCELHFNSVIFLLIFSLNAEVFTYSFLRRGLEVGARIVRRKFARKTVLVDHLHAVVHGILFVAALVEFVSCTAKLFVFGR